MECPQCLSKNIDTTTKKIKVETIRKKDKIIEIEYTAIQCKNCKALTLIPIA